MPEELQGRGTALYAVLSVVGLSFWFFLGFPFANHNESYVWLVQFKQYGLAEILSKGLKPVSTFRPLGVLTAWLGYKITGGIYLQQIFNFVVAILAWLLLFLTVREKRAFAWTALVAGGALFSGYLYLFHLHGVFYSPLLLLVASLMATAYREGALRTKTLAGLLVLAGIVSLYHPLALAAFLAYMVGYAIEGRHILSRRALIVCGAIAAVSLIMIRILVPSRGLSIGADTFRGMLATYRMIELNHIVSAACLLLALGTVLSLGIPRRPKIVLAAATLIVSAAFIRLALPVLTIWIGWTIAKAIVMRKWRMALLVAATAVFPAAAATGSPTYAVFVILACSAVLPIGLRLPESAFRPLGAVAVAAVVLIVLVGASLRAGARVPVASRLAAPVLAEKEKTFQLEEIIKWWQGSQYRDRRLLLTGSAQNPIESADAADRTYRAPTSQNYLDAYLVSLNPGLEAGGAGGLVVTFGGKKMEKAERVFAVPGKYSGQAQVYSETG